MVAIPTRGALTLIGINQINTLGIVLTRITITFIYIDVTMMSHKPYKYSICENMRREDGKQCILTIIREL